MGIVGEHFRPEFVNRIDELVVFHPLGKEQMYSIADIQLDRLRKRLEDEDYKMDVSRAAMDVIIEGGYDPVYGARPLKREIQREIENPLAQAILGGQLASGATIKIDAQNGQLTFEGLHHSRGPTPTF